MISIISRSVRFYALAFLASATVVTAPCVAAQGVGVGSSLAGQSLLVPIASNLPSLVRGATLIMSSAIPRLLVDQKFQFAVATVTPNNRQRPVADVTWRSSSPEVASVSASGMVVGRTKGRTFISAVSGRSEVRVRVTVLEPPAVEPVVASVGLTPETTRVEVGATLQFAASARAADGTIIPNAEVLFASADTSIASVTTSGLLSARVPGQVSVLAIAGARSGTAIVEIFKKVEPQTPAPVPVPADTFSGIVLPRLPQATVSTAIPAVTGKRWSIPRGDMSALQAAVNGAVGGDEIVLPDGSEYVGSLVLSQHSGAGVVTLRSETVPTPGVRVSPVTAASFAKIITVDPRPAIGTAPGARGWRIIGVQALQRNNVDMNYGIVRLGTGSEPSITDFARDIVLDRIYVSAGSMGQTRRCVALNGASFAVINSWLADCHSKGFDSQAVAGWTGTGPYLIENNHLEASTEIVHFGGPDPKIVGMSPSDITIRNNHLLRPMSWSNAGYLVKNLFELKHAKRLLFEGNVLENNWTGGQQGFAILLQAMTDDATAPWSTIQDITIRNNIIKNSTGGIHLLSRRAVDGVTPTEPSKRFLITNNLFVDVGRDPLTGADGRMMLLLGDYEDLSIVSNTFIGGTPTASIVFDGPPMARLNLQRNVFQASTYGALGNSTAEGSASFSKFAPGAAILGNVFTSRQERVYPDANFFPPTLAADAFINPAAGDYTLRSALPFASSGGKLVGVNGAALLNATRNAVTR